MLIIWRPFCKYLCPLGAIYGFFNRFALYRMETDADKCISCGSCESECPVSAISEGDGKYVIDADTCIECGACADVCPVDAPSQA